MEAIMKIALLALAAACAVVVSAAPAAAQPELAPVVRMQLDSAVVMFRNEGFQQQGGFHGGALDDGESEVVTLDLRGGYSYMIVGVCDGDCSDLDFRLDDAAGNEVDSDFELDDVPMVAAAVSSNGSYSLTVSMASCSIEPCGYGVAVFAQRQ
jgi:hypothetical protein